MISLSLCPIYCPVKKIFSCSRYSFPPILPFFKLFLLLPPLFSLTPPFYNPPPVPFSPFPPCEAVSALFHYQVFNAHTQRFEGLDPNAPNGGRAKTPERKKSASKKPSRWREKHQEFLRTIRAARGTPEGGY